jgi:hypothetical protein
MMAYSLTQKSQSYHEDETTQVSQGHLEANRVYGRFESILIVAQRKGFAILQTPQGK